MKAIILVALLAVITPAVAQIGPPTVTIIVSNGARVIVDTKNITSTFNASGSLVHMSSFKVRDWPDAADYDALVGIEGCDKGRGIAYTQQYGAGFTTLESQWFSDSTKTTSMIANAVCKAMLLRTYLHAPGGKV